MLKKLDNKLNAKDIELKFNYLIYFCDGIGSVFDSQVLTLLNEISAKSFYKKVFLFLGVKNKNEKKIFLTKNVSAEIEVVFFRSYPNYPFFNFMIRKSLLKVIKNSDLNLDEVIFHTRGELLAWHLSKILKSKYRKNIIPDIRAASVEELIEFSELGYLKKTLKYYNYESAFKYLNKFSQLSAVSNSLKIYLVNKYKMDPVKIYITPCLSGPNFQFDPLQRTKIRNELNLTNDDILIVFTSGGIANWQNNEVLNILAEKGLKILNLSSIEIRHKNIINKFISYSEMSLYLNAADIAFIWRDKSIVNKVASPVKFSEYVCCGLPVIANETVDMIKDFLVTNSSGLLVNSLNDIDINSLILLKNKDRQAIAEAGLSNFGIDKITKSYIQIYSELNH